MIFPIRIFGKMKHLKYELSLRTRTALISLSGGAFRVASPSAQTKRVTRPKYARRTRIRTRERLLPYPDSTRF
jgi:hypothetical protein